MSGAASAVHALLVHDDEEIEVALQALPNRKLLFLQETISNIVGERLAGPPSTEPSAAELLADALHGQRQQAASPAQPQQPGPAAAASSAAAPAWAQPVPQPQQPAAQAEAPPAPQPKRADWMFPPGAYKPMPGPAAPCPATPFGSAPTFHAQPVQAAPVFGAPCQMGPMWGYLPASAQLPQQPPCSSPWSAPGAAQPMPQQPPPVAQQPPPQAACAGFPPSEQPGTPSPQPAQPAQR
mgnify:CR=1 FL=1